MGADCVGSPGAQAPTDFLFSRLLGYQETTKFDRKFYFYYCYSNRIRGHGNEEKTRRKKEDRKKERHHRNTAPIFIK